MEENITEGEEPEHDIIQLLNTKKKNREILTVTNAAVDALTARQHPQTKNPLNSQEYNIYEEVQEYGDVNDSFVSSSSKEGSFNGRHRVRISSRLLREIKPPLHRSNSTNEKSSSEKGNTSSSNLFSSQCSSDQSSIRAVGPLPTVIKYSSDQDRQGDQAIATSKQERSHQTGTPVVVKYTQGCLVTGSEYAKQDLVLSEAKNTKCKTRTDTGSGYILQIGISNKDSGSKVQKGVKLKVASGPKSPLEVNDGKENVSVNSYGKTNKPQNPYRSTSGPYGYLTEAKEVKGTGLSQGAPSSHLVHVVDSDKDQVKAVSFGFSEREKATKEILSRRQENKQAIRRVVQPKFVDTTNTKQDKPESKQSDNLTEKTSSIVSNDVTSENANLAAKTASEPVIQVPTALEKQMTSLMKTLDAIETQCKESHVWQEQQQELDRNLKLRDERRLQNLEDMQKQLLEYQLKCVHLGPHVAAPHLMSTSAASGAIESLSGAQGKSTTQDCHEEWHPGLIPAGRSSKGLVQGPLTANPLYRLASEHKSPAVFKTSIDNKPCDLQSDLKRKFVRNMRTQTSPQDSSSVSSSEMTSSVETPLPRKRPPVPMFHRDVANDWELRGKHVQFDTPDVRNPDTRVKGTSRNHDDEAIFGHGRTGGPNQPRYPTRSLVFERQNLLPSKTSEGSNYIVNDIGKLRQEVKDALKVTERTKQSLKNLHANIHSQISDDEILAPPDHTQSFPLDAYLRATRDIPQESQTPRVEETLRTETGDKVHEPEHHVDALHILKDVQRRKENLESNLESLTRQHEEQHLYRLTEDLSAEGTASEALRIRKEVAKKIEEIGGIVKLELQDEERKRLALQKETSKENAKTVKLGAKSIRGVLSSTERRAISRNTGKENQQRSKTAAKQKITKPVPKQSQGKWPLENLPYVSRVYGRQDHVPRRTTLRSPHLHHQSPTKLTKAGGTKSRHQQRWDDSLSSISDDNGHVSEVASHKPRYYFQPSVEHTQVVMRTHDKKIQTPLAGQLMSMAIPLGKPKTDPSLRLPVYITEDTPEPPRHKLQAVSSSVQQPNVAVITIKDGECIEDEEQQKHKNTRRRREKLALERKVLPNVDIETSSQSEISESSPVKSFGPQILPCPDPLPRPAASEYEEFKDYEAVRNLEEMEEENEKKSAHDEESVISLRGLGTSKERKPSYRGPAFPPENIPPDLCDSGRLYGSVAAENTASETIENKAMEWVEQELLARVVSEMAPPLRDPTATLNRTQSSSSFTGSDVTDHDTEQDVLTSIGPRGVQLFVDAGIPVDNELVRNLITEVLKEKVCTMIGYPKPQEEPSLPQKPIEEHTEDESLSEECSRVGTPVRTPSVTSPPASRSASRVLTPEETDTVESSSSLLLSDHVTQKTTGYVKDRLNEDNGEIEEGYLEDSVGESPVVTPVATPTVSPTPSTVLVPTPGVSEQDLPDSEKTGVETPEVTVYIRDSTPDESMQEVEDDLKEQTLIEEQGKEEDELPDPEVPTVQFIPEPERCDTKVTNSPSSITTTTYSTQSTMGTVATDDEISEGEQLQPFVHVGQYSEGEFALPSVMVRIPDNMTTMQEIPDDIFDSFDNANKKQDGVKHAVSGLLRLNEERDETSGATVSSVCTNAQQREASDSLLSQESSQAEFSRSEGEVPARRDVVAALLTKIRSRPFNGKTRREARKQDMGANGSASAGDGDLSPGELSRQNHNAAVNLQSAEESMDRPQGSSVFDSDENNNESERSGSLHEPQNESWRTSCMVTPPKKLPSSLEQSAIKQRHSTSNVFPRVVQVEEAQHQGAPAGLFSSGQKKDCKTVAEDNITVETLSDVDLSPADGQVNPQPAHIQLTLPSAEPSVSEGSLELNFDDTVDVSSTSGGEITSVPLNQTIFI